MFRSIFILSLLVLTNISHADAIEDALCKDEGRFCKNRQQKKQSQVEKKPIAINGEGWEVIDGPRKDMISDYLLQVLLSTSYADCNIKKSEGGSDRHSKISTNSPEGSWFQPIYYTHDSNTIIELNKYSPRPLFFLSLNNTAEIYITTNAEHTKIESLSFSALKVNETPLYTGALDKPQLLPPQKTIKWGISCTAN